jgi:hypothetical protein
VTIFVTGRWHSSLVRRGWVFGFAQDLGGSLLLWLRRGLNFGFGRVEFGFGRVNCGFLVVEFGFGRVNSALGAVCGGFDRVFLLFGLGFGCGFEVIEVLVAVANFLRMASSLLSSASSNRALSIGQYLSWRHLPTTISRTKSFCSMPIGIRVRPCSIRTWL